MLLPQWRSITIASITVTTASSMRYFDIYNRNARLKPALIAVLPLIGLVTALGLDISLLTGVLSGLLSTAGLTLLLAQFGRDFGKGKEKYLFERWGGKPSVVKMRHGNTTINSHTRHRYHAAASHLLGIDMPSQEQEQNDSDAADAKYEAYSNLLLERTRSHAEFPLVFQELTNYGFRRNLWGMKPVALAINSVSIAIEITIAVFGLLGYGWTPPVISMALLVVSVLLLGCWIFLITPDWVRTAADAYAERLLAASEKLCDIAATAP